MVDLTGTSRPRRRIVRRFVVVAALACVACGLQAQLKDLMPVMTTLQAKYGVGFTVNLQNGDRLQITAVNAGEQMRKEAVATGLVDSIARTAYIAYPKRDSLTSISVGFAEVTGSANFRKTVTFPGRIFFPGDLRALADSSGAPPKPQAPVTDSGVKKAMKHGL